jgi:hypothetical protein
MRRLKQVAIVPAALLVFPGLWLFFNACMVHPVLAFIPAAVFAISAIFVSLQRYRGAHVVFMWVVALVWCGYGFWEQHVARTIPLEDVPIRVDLVLGFPIFYGLTVAGLYVLLRPNNSIQPTSALPGARG